MRFNPFSVLCPTCHTVVVHYLSKSVLCLCGCQEEVLIFCPVIIFFSLFDPLILKENDCEMLRAGMSVLLVGSKDALVGVLMGGRVLVFTVCVSVRVSI